MLSACCHRPRDPGSMQQTQTRGVWSSQEGGGSHGRPPPHLHAIPDPGLSPRPGRWSFLAVLMAEASSLMSLLIFEN